MNDAPIARLLDRPPAIVLAVIFPGCRPSLRPDRLVPALPGGPVGRRAATGQGEEAIPCPPAAGAGGRDPRR